MSHSHGWSSGPTSALTEFVLGLRVTGPAGKTWMVAPQFGDLVSVEGGFTTNLGKFKASWATSGDEGYQLEFSTPQGTSGTVKLPVLQSGKVPSVKVNGTAYEVKGLSNGSVEMNLQGGEYQIQVSN